MNLVKRITAGARAFLRGFEDYDDKKYVDFVAGPLTRAGTRISEVSALKLSAVYAAVSFIASVMASLPLVVYRRLPAGGNERALEHPLYDRLHNRPNSTELTSWQWRFTGIVHKVMWGNWYTHLRRPSYENVELVPLLPDRTKLDPQNKTRYISRDDLGKPIYIPRDQVLRIPHFSLDGIEGKGIIHFARESLGISSALDTFAGSFFGNGTHPGGFVEIGENYDPDEESREGLQKDFNRKYAGLGKSHNVIFLPPGMKWASEGLDPKKSQALESRQFSVLEVARWTGLPPHILKDLVRATFSNIEQQSLELVMYALMPWATQLEQAMNIAFFDDAERRTHFVKLELKGLLRGDLASRQGFYESMIDRGVMNSDEVRDLEELNPQPRGLGQIYISPLNYVNKETLLSNEPLRLSGGGEGNARRAVPAPPTWRMIVSQRRTSAYRRKTTIAWKPKFQEYGAQIVAKEVAAVRAAVEAMLSQKGIVDFRAWLEQFYRDFEGEVRDLVAPLVSSYADAILLPAQDEIGSEADISQGYGVFKREYVEALAVRHVGSSRGQLRQLLEAAQEEQANEAESIARRLDEWEEKRPEKIVMRESVRAESAFARQVFLLCGVAKLRSVAYGDNCPYCRDLDGKVVGINEPFLPAGDFQPDGAERPLTVIRSLGHPPYHDGCDCGVEAAIE